MNKAVLPTVEIFHDSHTDRQDIQPALDGLAIISSVIGSINLLQTNRRLKITDETAYAVNPYRIRWPQLPADINLVLTPRPIYFSKDTITEIPTSTNIIRNVVGHTVTSANVAIIDTSVIDRTKGVTAHEIGHIFGINEDQHADGHCLRSSCIMYELTNKVERQTRVQSGRLKMFAENARLIAKQYKSEVTYPKVSFCEDCSTNLLHIAARKGLAKIGIHLPS